MRCGSRLPSSCTTTPAGRCDVITVQQRRSQEMLYADWPATSWYCGLNSITMGTARWEIMHACIRLTVRQLQRQCCSSCLLFGCSRGCLACHGRPCSHNRPWCGLLAILGRCTCRLALATAPRRLGWCRCCWGSSRHACVDWARHE